MIRADASQLLENDVAIRVGSKHKPATGSGALFESELEIRTTVMGDSWNFDVSGTVAIIFDRPEGEVCVDA